jgi:hypothetical protein
MHALMKCDHTVRGKQRFAGHCCLRLQITKMLKIRRSSILKNGPVNQETLYDPVLFVFPFSTPYSKHHVRYCRKNGSTVRQYIHQLFVDFKKIYDSVRREALYNIVIEFCVPTKLVRMIKMYLNKTYSKVRRGKHLCDNFPKWPKTRRCFIATAFQICFRIYH